MEGGTWLAQQLGWLWSDAQARDTAIVALATAVAA
jgi:hypothetical protein